MTEATTITMPALQIDPARRCMLVERVAEVFNDIPMANAVQRVILVGKGVQTAVQNNDALKTMVQDSRFIESLHAAAKSRSTGVAVFPPALQSEFGSSREAQRV